MNADNKNLLFHASRLFARRGFGLSDSIVSSAFIGVHRRLRISTLYVALLLAAASHATAADWRMDVVGSRLEFAATFEKAPAPGVFKEFDTRLAFDPDKPAGGKLDVTIKTASADMANADINKAIAGPEWFDFGRYPQATFRASEIRRVAAGRYLAKGILTLKGAQRPVEVPFTWNAAADSAAMEGELTVQRRDFDIGTGEWAAASVIGPDVKIKFRVRLRKAD
jgi:polyisoprenoid-binding protein YceI